VFKPEPSIAWIPALREQIVAVVESINQPQVSIPGKQPQQVSGHLVGVRNGNGTLSVYVGLHLPRTAENVVYVHHRAQLTAEQSRDAEAEGLQFLESMGFMLDNLNFGNLSPEVQDAAVKRVPLLSDPRARGETAAPARAGSERARLARLLASF
jgi:hypothetical protein